MPILDYEDKIQGYISFDMNIVQTAYEFSEFSIPDNKTDFNFGIGIDDFNINNNNQFNFAAGNM